MFKNVTTLTLAISFFASTSVFAKNIQPSDTNIKYGGRISSNYEYDWPGIYIKTKFTGTSISAIFSGDGQYNVFVDGVEKNKIWTSGTNISYSIASGLSPQEHTIFISKVNETNYSKQAFGGFEIDDDASLIEPDVHEHKIEYIGDSFMVGYAAESGSNSASHPNPTKAIIDSTNSYKAFPAVSARIVDAEYMINAYSGLGVLNDANGNVNQTVPNCYDYTLHASKSIPWNFSSWIPDIVVIGLEINDFIGNANQATYEDALHAFIARIRNNYNGHPYFILNATTVYQHPEALVAVTNVVNKQVSMGNKVFYFNYEYFDLGFSAWNAVHWHPNVEEHAAVGTALAEKIDEIVIENSWPQKETPIAKTEKNVLNNRSIITGLNKSGLTFFLQESGEYSINIYSLNGKVILNVNTTYFSSGNHHLNLKDIKIVDSIYFAVLLGKDFKNVSKIVVK